MSNDKPREWLLQEVYDRDEKIAMPVDSEPSNFFCKDIKVIEHSAYADVVQRLEACERERDGLKAKLEIALNALQEIDSSRAKSFDKLDLIRCLEFKNGMARQALSLLTETTKENDK